ncbi:hypothetical protein I3843_15G134500 [Carya illinoinensis]|nr:hypothetical protein I3843_15G134500 [Carya illinoinensis]
MEISMIREIGMTLLSVRRCLLLVSYSFRSSPFSRHLSPLLCCVLPSISVGLAELPYAPPSSSSFLVYSWLLWCKNPCFLHCFPSKLCPVLYPKNALFFCPNVELEAPFFPLIFSSIFRVIACGLNLVIFGRFSLQTVLCKLVFVVPLFCLVAVAFILFLVSFWFKPCATFPAFYLKLYFRKKINPIPKISSSFTLFSKPILVQKIYNFW